MRLIGWVAVAWTALSFAVCAVWILVTSVNARIMVATLRNEMVEEAETICRDAVDG